jgi:translocation and assembly module TamB
MRRRRLVALVAATVLAMLGLATVVAVLLVTRTNSGREELRRRVVVPFLAGKATGGDVYVGKVSGNLISEITIDTIAIREKHTNELFLSTGRVTLRFDVRDFVDSRIFIKAARVEHPYVHIVQHENGIWNFKEIFASSPEPPKPKDEKRRAFGDYVVIDSTYTRGAQFLLTLPWQPDKELRGAARDSSIRVHLTNPAKAVTRRADGFGRTYAWSGGHGLITHARLADPDSDVKFGKQFVIDTLSMNEYEPTFQFRKLSADVSVRGDSVWFKVPHFELPASVGKGSGKVWWGSDLPVRYDIAVRGDSVALDDVNWVYPTLPRSGGGSVNLLIKNDGLDAWDSVVDRKKLAIVDFKLTKMDVRSTGSHLTGDMSFGIGQPVLLVRNVDLRADPVSFDLLRTLNGKPFTQDWRGDLFGTVNGRGGPLTNFVVDDAKATFRDAHVPGAVSKFSGKGELDILAPAFTVFHGFGVDAESIDLRTIEFLFPNFPRLGGFASGVATLDSSWLDVRFSNASMTLQDGPGEPSRFTGSGRITYGEYMTYDVALDAQPLSFTMLARSPKVFSAPLRGLVNGPIRAKGTSPDLAVRTSLQGSMGALTFDGRVDIDSIGGYGVHGRGEVSALNPATLLERKTIRPGTVSGHYNIDVVGETPAKLVGSADVTLERTIFDSVRVYESQAHVRFGGGKMTVDSLRLRTAAATITATGGIGLPKGTSDTLSFKVMVDSLGGLRRWLSTSDSVIADGEAAAVDSLSGSGSIEGKAFGTMDLLGLSGRLGANRLYINKERFERASATFDLRDLLGSASGTVRFAIDTVTLGGIDVDSVGATVRLNDINHRQFTASLKSRNGPTVVASGVWNNGGGADSVTVEGMQVAIGDDRWLIAVPAHVIRDSTRFAIDTLMLRNRDSGYVTFAASVPNAGQAFARLRAKHVAMSELGILEQLADSLSGVLDLTLSATGTKASPVIVGDASLNSVQLRSVDIDGVTLAARYSSGRVIADMQVTRKGKRAVTASASLPFAVTLFGLREREDSISGVVDVNSTDLAIVKALIPNASAKLQIGGRVDTAHVTLSGTMRNKILGGSVFIADGSAYIPQANVTIARINGSITGRGSASQDSIAIKLDATDDEKAPGRMSVTGFVKNLLQTSKPQVYGLALSATNFHAFNKRSLAEAYVSTDTLIPGTVRRRPNPLRLTGTSLAPELTGSILVDRGSIFIPDRDLARKLAVQTIVDSLNVVDTAAGGRPRSRSALVSSLMTNLRTRNVTVTLGDVHLRSAEADVKLVGSLNVLTSNQVLRAVPIAAPPFQVEGTLRTAGGSYNLNLGEAVQREFQVLPGGTVTFDGPADNPILDIQALYNVRRPPPEKDLGVIVKLSGRLVPYPGIDLSSNSDYGIGASDLVSYLFTGKPGFDYGANQQTTQAIASVFGPTISAVAADRLRNTLGSLVDVQFQLGQPTLQARGTSETLSQSFYSSTVGAGKQFGNVSLSVSSSLCGLNATQQYNARDMLGAQAEYRFNSKYASKVAYDPGTQGRACGATQDFITFIRTPNQFSFSFSQTWQP